MTSKFFRVVYESGILWVDGVKKQPGARRDFFISAIESKVGKDADVRGLFEICDSGPHFYPERECADA